jgi:hypothetical protein
MGDRKKVRVGCCRRDAGKRKDIMASVLSKLQGKIVHIQARKTVDLKIVPGGVFWSMGTTAKLLLVQGKKKFYHTGLRGVSGHQQSLLQIYENLVVD